MSWSASKISRQMLADILGDTAAFDLSGTGVDALKAALYNDSITPDADAAAASYAYNAGQWANTNEVTSTGQWDAGGVALSSPAVTTPSSGVVMFDAADTSSGSAATLANVYGALIYDDDLASPVANQGICHNYFGGVNAVTNGTFTVVWSANGLFRITV